MPVAEISVFGKDQLPQWETSDVNGVSVTVLVIDNGELFHEPNESYGKMEIDITVTDKGGTLQFDIWPWGDDSDSNRFTVRCYDDDSQLYRMESRTCGSSYGCQTLMDINYDFSGSSNTIWPGQNVAEDNERGRKVDFSSDNLLLAYGVGDNAPPSNWPEAIGSPDVLTDTLSGITSNVCGGNSVEAEIELENNALYGSVSGSATVTNELNGNTSSIGFDIPEGNTTTINPSITIPSDTIGKDLDVMSVDI